MEHITANGTDYPCKSVVTGTNSISFTVEGQSISAMEALFREVSELAVSGDDGKVYGTYENLDFESATVYGDGSVRVCMHIPSELELRMKELEQTQNEQDAAIAELYGGGEAE